MEIIYDMDSEFTTRSPQLSRVTVILPKERAILASKDIVIVNNDNKFIKLINKKEVETTKQKSEELYFTVSALIFNSNKKLLIQKRSRNKTIWANMWSISVSGHPQMYETCESAIRRKAKFELGISNISDVQFIYRQIYQVRDSNGKSFNELCFIFVCKSDDLVYYFRDDISQINWINWHELCVMIMDSDYINPQLSNVIPLIDNKINQII